MNTKYYQSLTLVFGIMNIIPLYVLKILGIKVFEYQLKIIYIFPKVNPSLPLPSLKAISAANYSIFKFLKNS